MKKLLLLVTLLSLAATPLFAQGPVTGPYLVDYFSNNVGRSVTYQASFPGQVAFATFSVSFTEPQYLTTTTAIPLSSINVITPPSPCTITGAQLMNPASANFRVTIFVSGCSTGIVATDFNGVGPATHDGVFSNGAPNPTFLTITSSSAPDQQLRLVNFGTTGTPLSSPVGDVCANIYVFDANQEMIACCSCRITPNGVRTLSVFDNLTINPVTSVVPVNGDIKIVSTVASSSTCSPLGYNAGLSDSLLGFGTHVNTVGAGAFISETQVPAAALSGQEQDFLPQACQFARYLGSGKGVCSCGNNPI